MSKSEVKIRLSDATRFRMKIPLGVPLNIAKIMQDCWLEDPQKRPSFKCLHKRLSRNFAELSVTNI